MITENELNVIKGLMHYLNANVLPPASVLDAEISLSDSNGEPLGRLAFDTSATMYCFYPAGGTS